MAEYTTRVTVDAPFDDVVAATEDALAAEGFGVLCDVDVRATLKQKLDAEFRDYRILGACNPPLAHEAMGEELELGALLPCNVVVYATDDGDVAVSAVRPTELLSLVENEDLDPIAAEVEARLDDVLAAVVGEFA
ncbi:MAG: DUF302 domain-containing protein [Halobacteriaceae archaeon]